MKVRAIRGATQLEVDEREHLRERTAELVAEVLRANGLDTESLISIIFTSTSDLRSDFPAAAARDMGLGDVPLLCAVEIDVPDSLPRVVRLLAHANLDVSLAEVRHVYLHGATVLRRDLAQ